MNQNKFLQPLSENITKTEDTLSLTINNIVISLVSTFRFKHNNMTNVIHVNFIDEHKKDELLNLLIF